MIVMAGADVHGCYMTCYSLLVRIQLCAVVLLPVCLCVSDRKSQKATFFIPVEFRAVSWRLTTAHGSLNLVMMVTVVMVMLLLPHTNFAVLFAQQIMQEMRLSRA